MWANGQLVTNREVLQIRWKVIDRIVEFITDDKCGDRKRKVVQIIDWFKIKASVIQLQSSDVDIGWECVTISRVWNESKINKQRQAKGFGGENLVYCELQVGDLRWQLRKVT
jgi:hypothetical protein